MAERATAAERRIADARVERMPSAEISRAPITAVAERRLDGVGEEMRLRVRPRRRGGRAPARRGRALVRSASSAPGCAPTSGRWCSRRAPSWSRCATTWRGSAATSARPPAQAEDRIAQTARIAEATVSTRAQSAAAEAIRDLTSTANDLSQRIERQASTLDARERLDEILARLRDADQRLRESDERTKRALGPSAGGPGRADEDPNGEASSQ